MLRVARTSASSTRTEMTCLAIRSGRALSSSALATRASSRPAPRLRMSVKSRSTLHASRPSAATPGRRLAIRLPESRARPRPRSRSRARPCPKKIRVALILGSISASESMRYRLQLMGAEVTCVQDMKTEAAGAALVRAEVIVLAVDALRRSLFETLVQLRRAAAPAARIAVLGPAIDPFAPIISFECGADEHLSTSWSKQEILLRILRLARYRCGMRVSAPWHPTIGDRFRIGALEVDLDRRGAFANGRKVPLTSGEM